MRLLDTYCCQGGASTGYAQAGFEVYGIDIDPQPRYPFPFIQADAIAALERLVAGERILFSNGEELGLADFDAIHGSPPCQAYTNAQKIQGNEHPDLVAPTRELLERSGLPWVIENVPGSPLVNPIALCGAGFGLETYRHRLFESSVELTEPRHEEHQHRTTKMGRPPQEGEFMHIVGNFSGVPRARQVMGMDWANRDGLREAIPPIYARYVGRQLMDHITMERAA